MQASDYHAPRGYVIPDEPAPGRLSALAVTPFSTLLGLMLGGAAVGLPWMVLNGFAIGSATRRQEAAIALATALAMGVAVAMIIALGSMHLVPSWSLPYLGLVVHAIRMTGAYSIYLRQDRSFELYQYFGGRVARHGWAIAVAVFVLRFYVLASMERGFVTATLLF